MLVLEVLIILLAAYASVLIAAMIFFSLRKPKAGSVTVLVLGCKVKGSIPSQSLKRRLESAFKYLNENPNTVCIVSGGKGSDESISEAQCMKSYLVSKGILSERIIKEERSVNTRENFVNSYEIVCSRGLCRDIVVATDFYHQLRAYIIAKKCGINIAGAISSVPGVKTLVFHIVRELAAVPVEIFKR